MDAIESLITRRSASKLTEPAPAGEALERILESAACAPDHGRLRPWRFFVIASEARHRFGKLLAELAQRAHGPISEAALEREREKALPAPMIIVVAAICNASAKIPVIEQIGNRDARHAVTAQAAVANIRAALER